MYQTLFLETTKKNNMQKNIYGHYSIIKKNQILKKSIYLHNWNKKNSFTYLNI